MKDEGQQGPLSSCFILKIARATTTETNFASAWSHLLFNIYHCSDCMQAQPEPCKWQKILRPTPKYRMMVQTPCWCHGTTGQGRGEISRGIVLLHTKKNDHTPLMSLWTLLCDPSSSFGHMRVVITHKFLRKEKKKREGGKQNKKYMKPS